MNSAPNRFNHNVNFTQPGFSSLVIDGDKGITDLLGRIFTRCGFQVDLAESMVHGLALAESCHYDLIMLDAELANSSIIKLIEKLRKSNHQAEIITMTTNNSLEMEIMVRQQKVSYHLIKPFEVKEIMSLINHFVTRKDNLFLIHAH